MNPKEDKERKFMILVRASLLMFVKSAEIAKSAAYMIIRYIEDEYKLGSKIVEVGASDSLATVERTV